MGVTYHEWTSAEYSSLDWIVLVFSDAASLCMHLGSGEASVEILTAFDPEAEKKELFEMFGEKDITVRSTDHSGTRKWKSFVGQVLTGYLTEESDKELTRSVTLLFGPRAVQISAGEDRLEAKALTK